ncbi:MAG: RNA polymerase sigma factor [Allomuricauda sp.]
MKTTQKIYDGLLVLEYLAGNDKSLSLLVKRHHPRLCGHSYQYTLDIEASKDIVQDAWKTVIGKLHTLKDPNSFGAWATKIVTRKSLDHINRIRRDRGQLEEYSSEKHIVETGEDRESEISRLLKAIKELPYDHQKVLRLFYLEEYSLKEIGDILEISVGTTKSRLFHAREKLKKILKKDSDENRH